jgi:hypothetical protein
LAAVRPTLVLTPDLVVIRRFAAETNDDGRPTGEPGSASSVQRYVQAPIFVFREFMRHRLASYKGAAGRLRRFRLAWLWARGR